MNIYINDQASMVSNWFGVFHIQYAVLSRYDFAHAIIVGTMCFCCYYHRILWQREICLFCLVSINYQLILAKEFLTEKFNLNLDNCALRVPTRMIETNF